MDLVKPLIAKYTALREEALGFAKENNELAEANARCNNTVNVKRYCDSADWYDNRASMYEGFIADLKALDADLNWR